MPIISLDNVSYSYDKVHNAVSGVNFTAEKGEYIAVIGHNGSGKSTLTKLLNGLLIPTEGTATVDGFSSADKKSLFEILPRGVNKGLSLVKLVEYLGIDSKKTIAIGDYNNDIGMFESAAIGVAVSNACQAALDAADYITVSNEEHAIAQVICDLKNGKLNF